MKFMTLGGTYTSNIWITYLGDKIDGPVDNTESEAGIKNVHSLFDGEFERAIKNTKFSIKKRKISLELSCCGYYFRPETFGSITFLLNLEERLENLNNAFKDKENDIFFTYSTSDLDESYSEDEITNFKSSLPEFIKNRLVIISEKENSIYNKFFPTFYLENQKEIDIFENSRPKVLNDWLDFVKEQTEKGFFPKKEKKSIEEILED